MAKKRPNIIGKDVIGFDETHNGFHLNHEHNVDLPLIISGYLVRNCNGSCSQEGCKKYTRKRGAMNPKGKLSLKDMVERATYFLSHNPNFFYMRIPSKEHLDNPIKTRALAMATISLKFFEAYNLNESRTFICIDKPNNQDFSDDLCWWFGEYLKLGNLLVSEYSQKVYAQEKADERNLACKLADRVGYYTLALKFRTPQTNWPCRNKLLHKDDFIELAMKRS